MLRQYSPPRGRTRILGGRMRSIGTVETGQLVTLDGARHIVEGWIPRDYAKRGADGRFTTMRIAGGHLAQVRRLRDGRRRQVADHWLRAAMDAEDAA